MELTVLFFLVILTGMIALTLSRPSKTKKNDAANRSKRNRYNAGEEAVRKMMGRYCKTKKNGLANNVTLKYQDGTTQIDHILFSRQGIFIIETKHYTGWIFASARSKQWMQIIHGRKYPFQNPVHQNYKHICAVRQLLDAIPEKYINGVVVFTGDAEFKKEKPSGVVQINKLIEYIEKEKKAVEILSEDEMNLAIRKLELHRMPDNEETDAKHRHYLNQKFKN